MLEEVTYAQFTKHVSRFGESLKQHWVTTGHEATEEEEVLEIEDPSNIYILESGIYNLLLDFFRQSSDFVVTEEVSGEFMAKGKIIEFSRIRFERGEA